MSARPKKSTKIDENKLRGWNMLGRFRSVLARVREQVPRTARETHGLRTHQVEEYLSLFLLAMFNPVLGSMRALCQASRLERVQQQCQAQSMSLSRFSEAQEVFEPELLRRALSDLVEESAGVLGASRGGWPPQALRIVDSTLWKVVPRMQWAQWRHQSIEQRAVRLHLKLRVEDEAPAEALITTGKTCERAAWRGLWRAGEIYIGDRNYGEDYGMLAEMVAQGCDFLVRLRQSAVITWESQETLDAESRAAGIVQAGLARLGRRGPKGPWRVIVLERPGQETLILVASACWEKMSALEVTEVYRQRWKVELFFRWLKCLVPCRHWLAESERGVTFQIYVTLVAALLLAQTLGERPNRRMMELLQFFEMGYASEEELIAGIVRAEREARRKRELAAQKAAAQKIA
jgi:hypothetical protein